MFGVKLMKRVSKKILVILLAVAFLFGFVSCGKTDGVVAGFSVKSSKETIGSGTASFHTLTSLPENTVTTSGLTALSFEPSSSSVCVTELTKGNVWSVLPLFENGSASVIDIVLRTADGVFYLNSQDNSVAFGSYKYETSANGVSVEYLIADNAENVSGAVSSVTKGAAARIKVDFTLTDGDLRVSIDCGKIELSPGAVLESISLMPYFGAIKPSSEGENSALEQAVLSSAQEKAGIPDGILSSENATAAAENENETAKDNGGKNGESEEKSDNDENKSDVSTSDFLLVPDGCGAIMYTDRDDSATAELVFNVYGSGENSADIPVFGIKKGSGAFSAVIGEGAALAEIKARRSEKDPFGAATVYPVFTITEGAAKNGRYNYIPPYSGNISVCYRFLSGSEANYVSMAAVCREELIRNGTLSSKTLSDNDYPLNISIIASADGTSKRTASTFEETEDLLQLLKAKGIENAEIVLNGIFSGGLAYDGSSLMRVLRVAGGASGLQKLFDYAEKQKFTVFAGVNLVKSAGLKSNKTAKDANGDTVSSFVFNPIAPQIGQAKYAVDICSADSIEKNTVELMNGAERLSVSGLCILDGDIGSYSDSSSGMNSEQVSALLKNNISAFATRKSLAISSGSLNTVKNVSLLLNSSLHTVNAESEAYRAVPLIPAVLHSTVRYSGAPVNTGSAAQLELLKCVEYGAQPYYLWVFDKSSDYCYEQTFNDAVSFVLRASDELGELGQCRIVSHSETESNVFCTGYDNGALVYVNYNNYSVNIGDISVLPYDYIRIN